MFKMILVSNNIPTDSTYMTDAAVWRRIKIIPFIPNESNKPTN